MSHESAPSATEQMSKVNAARLAAEQAVDEEYRLSALLKQQGRAEKSSEEESKLSELYIEAGKAAALRAREEADEHMSSVSDSPDAFMPGYETTPTDPNESEAATAAREAAGGTLDMENHLAALTAQEGNRSLTEQEESALNSQYELTGRLAAQVVHEEVKSYVDSLDQSHQADRLIEQPPQ